MTLGFMMFTLGAVMIMSGLRGQSIADTVRGVVSPRRAENPAEDIGLYEGLGGVGRAGQVGAEAGAGGASGRTMSAASTSGGASGVIDQVEAIGRRHGLQPVSRLRAGARTSSGNVSNHSENSPRRAAVDLSN